MRLGDLDHLLIKLDAELCDDARYIDIADQIRDIIDNAPTVDPIIRCKDCKHRIVEFRTDKRMKNGGYYVYACKEFGELCGYWVWGGEAEQFCSDAERKEE